MFPTRIPSINSVCVRLESQALLHTRFHSDIMVLAKILWSYEYSVQFSWHLLSKTISLTPQVKFVGGARKSMLIWCHATGNFTRKTTRHIHICHFPMEPIALVIASLLWSAFWSSESRDTISKSEIYKKVFLFYQLLKRCTYLTKS